LHIKFEAIVGQLHMREAHSKKASIRLGMRQVVRDVREPRAAGLELLNDSQGLLDGLMHGMGNIAEGVQD